MLIKRWTVLIPLSFVFLLVFLVVTGTSQAQIGESNPTPVVITLTPDVPPTVTPSPTPDGALPPDRFEPNNDMHMAAPLGLGLETGLTLTAGDLDYFTGYLKTGQLVRISTFVYDRLDTRLKLTWNGQLAAENDDRSPADLGSMVTFTAPADGWYVLLVERATLDDGFYDLETALVEPTATATPLPTFTPTPTLTPTSSPTPAIQPDPAEPNDTPETARPVTPGLRNTYTIGAGDVDYFTFIAKAGNHYACETVTDRVDTLLTVFTASAVIGSNDDRGVGRVDSYLEWATTAEQPVVVKVEARGGSFGQYDFICQHLAPPTAPAMPPPGPLPAGEPPNSVPATAAPASTVPISLTVRHLGRVQLDETGPTTTIRLLVYYDANNDRQPGPGEGVANVSVLAVDAQGRRLVRVFTNAQGEAVFNLTGETIARVMVPFVPGWSARIRAGEMNDGIVLGLPAVRLPVFLPVQSRPEGSE